MIIVIFIGAMTIASGLLTASEVQQAEEHVVSDKFVALVDGEWVEYQFYLPVAGVYEVWLTSGGNDTRQAAQLSIDGGEPVLVIDEREPKKALSPREREKVVSRQLIGVVSLKKGKHLIRVQHAREPGFSIAFGL